MAATVELITYADRLGGDLPGLRRVLAGPLRGLFAGVHMLPFFDPHDGADAGFDPRDHTAVDPRLGTWDDVAALAADGLRLTVDVIVNHVSAQSSPFLDWLARGAESPYDGMFLTFGTVFPDGAREEDLLRLRYLAARALQLWFPGIQQIYYVGLLAGRNDVDLLRRNGIGRDVNRHYYYDAAEIAAAVRRPVVQALFALIRLHNTHPAFDGEFTLDADGDLSTARWTRDDDEACLEVRLGTGTATVRWSTPDGLRTAALLALADGVADGSTAAEVVA